MQMSQFFARTAHLPETTIVRASGFNVNYTLSGMKLDDAISINLSEYQGRIEVNYYWDKRPETEVTLKDMRAFSPECCLDMDFEDAITYAPVDEVVIREGFVFLI